MGGCRRAKGLVPAVSFRIRYGKEKLYSMQFPISRKVHIFNLLQFFDSKLGGFFMLKNQAAAAPAAQHTGLKNVRVLATSALLAAISVVLARLIIPMPNETTRF